MPNQKVRIREIIQTLINYGLLDSKEANCKTIRNIKKDGLTIEISEKLKKLIVTHCGRMLSTYKEDSISFSLQNNGKWHLKMNFDGIEGSIWDGLLNKTILGVKARIREKINSNKKSIKSALTIVLENNDLSKTFTPQVEYVRDKYKASIQRIKAKNGSKLRITLVSKSHIFLIKEIATELPNLIQATNK
jgi:hypothetical protein